MVNSSRPTFHLTLPEAQLQAPETPHYLEIALRLLETRLAELRDDPPETPPIATPQPPAAEVPIRSESPPLPPSVDITTQPAQEAAPSPAPRSEELRTPSESAPSGRRARWFHDQLPRITMPEGDQVTPRSLEELKELLRSHGLTPHPRGDASMLLWQVRNRLRGTVEVVGV